MDLGVPSGGYGWAIYERVLIMAKRKSRIPENETKAQCFKRVVEPRVNRAIKAIALVGSTSGNAYEYSKADVDAIMYVLSNAVVAIRKRFEGKGAAAAGFSLDKQK